MLIEKDFHEGQEAFYHESGVVYRVQVLESLGNLEWETYNLKILEVVRESPVFVSSEVGEEFECTKRRDASGYGGLWHLMKQ